MIMKKLWIYVIVINHPTKIGVLLSKMGQTVQLTREDAIRYATTETFGKIKGVINTDTVVYCQEHTQHAESIEFTPDNDYAKYDDKIRKNIALPEWDGILKNDTGAGSREIHTHNNGELFEDVQKDWIVGMVEVLKDSENTAKTIYDPYFYKVYIEELFFNMLTDSFKNNTKVDFALELAARFGKTTLMITMLIRLFEERGYKICILPSYWLSSLSSFESDLFKYEGFSDKIEFVSRDMNLSESIDNYYDKKMIVVEASLYTDDSDTDSVWENKFEIIKNLPSNEKCTMVDEADFGAWKTNSQKKINYLDSSLNIYLTGTGIDKVAFNLKNLNDNIIRFSYNDMLLVKSGQHPLFF